MRKNAMSALVAGATFLLLGGCMTGPDYVRPSIDSPTAWRISDQGARDLANLSWWEQFNDPVLNELVATALRENKDLLIATARIEEYAGYLGISRSQLYPQVGLGADASRQLGSVAGGDVLKRTFNTYDVVLGVNWEIDLWGKIRRQNESARAQFLASEDAQQGVVLTLVATVAGGYIGLRSLDRQLEIAKATAKSRGESYRIFQDRYAGGIISLLELSQNKSQYDEALATIPKLEKEIALQENALSVLLGRDPGPIARSKDIDQLKPPVIPAALPSSLLERRPDIREAEQRLIAANAQIGVAKAAYFPSISLTGALGVASGNLSELFSGASRIWQYGASLSAPVFTAGQLAGQVQVAEAQQKQALYAYQKAIQEAFRSVNDALADQDRTRAQLAAQRQQIDSLKTYSDMARLRYDNGYTSFLEVVDAERSLFNAQLTFTQSQQTLLQAMVNLYKAMGGGWGADGGKTGAPVASARNAPTSIRD
jgi:multidrug efflux system outer membrane protein